MIFSMTGFGRGESQIGSGHMIAEIRTVNHRFLDFSTKLPVEMTQYQDYIEKLARKRISRGHVYIKVSFDSSFQAEHKGVNEKYLAKIYQDLQDFASRRGIRGEIDLNALLNLPDAFVSEDAEVPERKMKKAIRESVGGALERCVEMRAREGKTLEKDIASNLVKIRKAVAKIDKRAPAAIKRSFGKTRDRVKKMLDQAKLDDSRWLTEVAIMSDKADFSEELVRLSSHIDLFEKELERGGDVAKKMTFILQEIHREVTTLGNKSSDTRIIRECLNIKEGTEKIREQAQNLE